MAAEGKDAGEADECAEGPWGLRDEAELVRRAADDPEAFGLLYEAHYAAILNYLYRRTLDVNAAEELTSNTFFKALRALPRYRHRMPFRAWLYRIATNEARMRWRSWWRRRRVQVPDWENQIDRVHFNSSPVESPEQLREKMKAYTRLHECLSQLPDRYQTVLVLRYLEELTIDEVAQVTGKRVGTVKSLIHRGLERLRRLMGEEGATFP
jgi:RNA polymerase sigma-70 factor, ECF subfamily